MSCSICLSSVSLKPKKLPCGHSFCIECINKWLETSTAHDCPECRTVIEIQVKPSVPRLASLTSDTNNLLNNSPYCIMFCMVLKGIQVMLLLFIFYSIGWLICPNPIKSNNPIAIIGNASIYIAIGIGLFLYAILIHTICKTTPRRYN